MVWRYVSGLCFFVGDRSALNCLVLVMDQDLDPDVDVCCKETFHVVVDDPDPTRTFFSMDGSEIVAGNNLIDLFGKVFKMVVHQCEYL